MSLLYLILAVCLLCLLLFFLYSRSVRGLLSASSERTHTPANFARPRISRDPALIQADYDIVVIGSGYGGGVAASRLARAGRKVCVLERGAELLNGQFPQSFKSALRETNMKDMRPGRYGSLGKASGLYQINKGKGQDVFTGSGLGGTSLINAGVFLRADKRVFEDPMWPTEIRTDADSLEQYYERGERMLRPSPYPETLPKPQKLSVFEQLANHLGIHHRLYRPPLTISFEDGTNGAGVAMSQSTGSGNECTGLNDGSKNSVYTTYLADAWTWGAEMFCGVDVSHLSKAEGENGYLVYYSLRNRQDRNRVMWVRAKEVVVLGAGALGTTEILLRSRSHGLSVSPLTGTRMSGNGDLLAFAYNCNQEVNAVGGEAHTISHTARCGPTITACIDMRGTAEAENVKSGFMIQEGAIPGALGPVIQAMIEARIPATRLYNSVEEVIARFKSWILGPYATQGSVNRTAVYLVMSHDENEGTLSIRDGKLDLRWSGIGAKSVEEGIKNLLGRATASMNGTFVAAPSITVHPLGGACVSHDNTGLAGVVNHMGQLYSGPESNIHEGIICVDAATIPTSLGVNPCATITALAERCCDLLIRQRGWNVDERPNEQLNFAQAPYRSQNLPTNLAQRQNELRLCDQHGGLMFDETLHGYLHVTDDDCGFESAFESAKMTSSSAKASMTVSLYRTASRSYRGCVTGSLSFSALSKDPLLITKGCVEFFTVDEDVSDAVNLIYTLELLDTNSREYVLHSHKTIDSRITLAPFRAWVATTTLFTTISREDGTRVAKGILKLSPSGFLTEMISLRCNSTSSYAEQTLVKARFLSFFGRNLISYLLSPLRPLHYSGSMKPLLTDYEKARPTEVRVQAMDGICFSIKIWQPSRAVPSKETPIMLIPGASVDHQIFSLPTIPVNTIDYFTSQGYRCYIPVLRFGINTEARNGWTVFDARLDVKAALEFIRAQENNSKIYAIVHCLGSIAAATALLQGDIEASWLCGMTCSQIFTDLIYSKDNAFKAQHQSLTKMYKALVGNWFSCRSTTSAPLIHYVLDQLLRFYPIGSRKELCNSAVCHRCDLPFGRCWSHANLNYATHARLDEIFDGIHMNFLTHLSRMGASPPHHIRSNLPDFANLVTSENMQRLVGLRICFLSGADNAVWEPNATKKSFDTFKQTFPGGRYDRVVIQGYGHLDCWMGKNAFIDVYPRVNRHIDFCSQSS